MFPESACCSSWTCGSLLAAPKVRFINYYQQNIDKRTPDENVYEVKCAKRRGTDRAKESTTRVRWDIPQSRSSHNQLEQISRSIVGECFELKDYRSMEAWPWGKIQRSPLEPPIVEMNESYCVRTRNLKIMVLMDASLRYRELKIFLLVGKYNRETHPRWTDDKLTNSKISAPIA